MWRRSSLAASAIPFRYAGVSTPIAAAVGIGVAAHEGEREVRLGELLLRVVQVAAVAHVGMRADGVVGAGEMTAGFGDQLLGAGELFALHGADRGGATLDREPARAEGDLTGVMLRVEHGAGCIAERPDLSGAVHHGGPPLQEEEEALRRSTSGTECTGCGQVVHLARCAPASAAESAPGPRRRRRTRGRPRH